MEQKGRHDGRIIQEYLESEGIAEEVYAIAMKRAVAFMLKEAMKERHMTKTAMAKAMKTSRPVLDRLLDPRNKSVTLLTLAKAAKVLGKRFKIELVDRTP